MAQALGGKLEQGLRECFESLERKRDQLLLNQAVRDQEDNELARLKEELIEVTANERESRS